jgi:UDP-glucose 4-epimerase
MDWKERKVVVTGGASFVGSSLVDALVSRGARVRVVDNLSSGRIENIKKHLQRGRVEFLNWNLTDSGISKR